MNKFKNRDYKFRVWDGNTMNYCDDSYSFCIFKNKVHEVDYTADYCQVQNFAYEVADVNLNPEDCAIMQYTGLKDKNKKEIYEGDILKISLPGNNHLDNPYSEHVVISEVKWINAIPVGEYDYSGWYASQIPTFVFNHSEIIGNIHENPELLKVGT